MPSINTQAMTRAEIIDLVAKDLERVEEAIGTDSICSIDAVRAIGQYLQEGGGKRLRPSLLLLSTKLCGYQGKAAIRLAAVVEIIHTATLVHDDVIDNAEVRRGQPSTNQRWGNQTSVLAGDWLYMQAFSLALRERNFHVLDLLIDLTQMMVEGELMQMDLLGHIDATERDYLDLVHRKTAGLFSVCGRLGAVLGNADSDAERRLADYGWNLGMAFQLVDDLLDFTASERVLGKPVGNDLREGKVTLPLIFVLKQCTAEERSLVETVVRDGGYDSVPLNQILELLQKYNAIKQSERRALEFTEKALAELSHFPDSDYKRALYAVADWVVDREN